MIVVAIGSMASQCAAPSGRASREPIADSIRTSSQVLDGKVYSGVLPCASCAGIETKLWLRDDHTFWRSRTYLGDKQDAQAPLFDLGHWVETVGGRVVLTSNNGAVARFAREGSARLVQLDVDGRPIDSEANHALAEAEGAFDAIGPLRLQGMYIYFADAAIFLPCNTEVRMPVAMVERHVDLEEDYLRNRSGPAAPLFVDIEADVRQMPAMEGEGVEDAIVVRSFVRSDTLESCGRPSDLTNPAGWDLSELDGAVVREQDGVSIPELTFSSGQVSGSTGCNRLTGPAVVTSDSLRLGPLAVTRRACMGSIENDFLAALDATDRFQVLRHRLILLDGDRSVAVFTLGEGQ